MKVFSRRSISMTEISSDAHSTKSFPKGRLANGSLSDVPPIFSFDEEDDDYPEIFDEEDDDYSEIQEEEPERETNEIVTGPLSDEAQLKMEVIESLLEKCDRHQLRLLAVCTNCETPFLIPALWVQGECPHCFLPFATMAKLQKRC
jgi:hypothetical protein